MVRKFLCVLFILLLMTQLSACNSDAQIAPVPSETASAVESLAPSTAPQPSWSPDILLTPAVSKTYEWEDSVGNLNRVSIRLPHLDSAFQFAAAFNAEIDRLTRDLITETEDCISNACSTYILSVDYEAWQNGHILSVLITTTMDFDYVEYDVYNFDLKTDASLTMADLCHEQLGMAYPVFLKYTRDRIWAAFEAKFAEYLLQYPGDYEFIRHLYYSDLSTLCRYDLFPDEAGNLMLICDHPSIAGAAYYPAIEAAIIDSELVPTDAEAWNWLFDLYLGVDFDNAIYAEKLLICAFEADEAALIEVLQTRSSEERDTIETAIRTYYTAKG